MGPVVWLAVEGWAHGGGYLWAALNWALGFRAAGCEVVWLACGDPRLDRLDLGPPVPALAEALGAFGLADGIACSPAMPSVGESKGRVSIEALHDADLLVNISNKAPMELLGRCRRTAMLDMDPGLTQVWISEGVLALSPHDVYFTIGDAVGRPGGNIPNDGIPWQYTPPCVALDHWPVVPAPAGRPFTTVSNWDTDDWLTHGQESYPNSKRTGFLPFLDLPSQVSQPLELALCLRADERLRLNPDEERERKALEKRGWRIVHSYAVASTPQQYQDYIQNSRGEFSCAKPSCRRLRNAWVSDRTLCYLASGKPAIVEHTGPSSFLPDAAGLLRFRNPDEAAAHLETVAADYERQCALARQLAEDFFDARKVAASVLERALA